MSSSFRSPVEVSLLKSKSSEFIVSSSGTNSSDTSSISDKFSVSDGSSFLESSFLFMNWHSTSCQSSLMSRISVDTHDLW